jgi:hypothetical protein
MLVQNELQPLNGSASKQEARTGVRVTAIEIRRSRGE